MKIQHHSSRALALVTGGVLATSAFLVSPAPARADKRKTYKYGAIALGALGAYWLSKGKNAQGAAAVAGAYAAYKQSQKSSNNDDRYSNYPDNPTYPTFAARNSTSNARYPRASRDMNYDLRPSIR